MKTETKEYYNLFAFILGFGLFILTRTTTYVPVAIVIAPVFILYFSRNTHPVLRSLILTTVGMVLSMEIALSSLNQIYNVGLVTLVTIGRNLMLGVTLILPFLADRLLYKKINGFASTLVFPISAVAIYFIDSIIGPFAGTGIFYPYTQYSNLALNQFLSVFGLWGIVFLLSWAGSAVVWCIENEFNWDKIKKGVITVSIVFICVLLYGGIKSSPMFYNYGNEDVRVAAIACKEESEEIIMDILDQRMYTSIDETIEKMDENMSTAAQTGAEFAVFQEFALVIPEESEDELKNNLKELAQKHDMYICLAYVTFPPLLEGEHDTDFLGHTVLDDEYEEGYNKALLINPKGQIEIEYYKHYLASAEGTWILDGEGEIETVDTPYGKIAVVICRDMEFPRYLLQAGRENADIVFAPAFEMDKSLSISYSQMQRAVENGFSFVRPAYFGLSVAVDYNGNILSQSNFFTTKNEIMIADIPTKGVKTIYSIIGDTFAWICCAAFIALIYLGVRKNSEK